MIVLVILASWILVLAFVAVLCVAAQRGEVHEQPPSPAGRWEEMPELIAGSAQVGTWRDRSAEPAARLLGAGGATG
jgi:uncharacterized protein with NRDE domain